MSLEFHLTRYERYRQEGVDCYRRGDGGRARFCLLKSAEHLFEVAARSDGVLKERRQRRAAELVTLARDLPPASVPARSRKGAVEGDGAQGEDDSDPRGDRFQVAERPSVRFADIAGLEDVKEEIRLRIIYPYLHAEEAAKYGVRRGGGILLYGPPGTGKTLLARAVAGEVDAPFYSVKPSEILSKWVGDAEKNVAALFASARSHPRSIIFIDEVEALAPRRAENQSTVMARLVPQILAELEGFDGGREGLLFIGATNEPWSLDPAIIRPGRFDEKIYVGLPDRPAILHMLEIHLANRPLSGDVDLDRLAGLLDGYSGADLRNICRKASDSAFLRAIDSGCEHPVDQETLLGVVREVSPSITPKELGRFREYCRRTG